MGRESKVEYAEGKERAEVRAHLDSQSLQLTGGKKLTVPLSDVKVASVDGDLLKVTAGKLKFSLKLGAREAELWRKKILSPPSLADKFGFKPGKAVTLVGALPAEVTKAAEGAKALAKLPAALTGDIAVTQLSQAKAEAEIKATAKALSPATALWLVYAKGGVVNGDHVIAMARAAGLKDTKVARVSETHAALRFIKAAR